MMSLLYIVLASIIKICCNTTYLHVQQRSGGDTAPLHPPPQALRDLNQTLHHW